MKTREQSQFLCKWRAFVFLAIFAIQLGDIGNPCLAQTATADPLSSDRLEIQRRFAIDPATPLSSRIRETPADVLKIFRDAGMAPEFHRPDEAELEKLAAAFDALPPLHQTILKNRLRSFSLVDNMPHTALTSTTNPGEPYRVFDITIRAEILEQNLSEWLTEKERTCFDSTESPLTVSIEAGSLDAVLYVLLHEATHVVDASLGVTPASRPNGKWNAESLDSEFAAGVWSDRTVVSSRYRQPALDEIVFRRNGTKLPVERAQAIYEALEKTPFVSLYGSSSCSEDLAEYVTVYHLTEKLNQPFRIVISDGDKEILGFEPMKSETVQERVGQMKRFYDLAVDRNDE